VAAELPVGHVQDPEFSLYRRHLQRVEPGAPRWRSNPSNPLGTLAAPDDRAGVWDEAFYPLATGRWTRGDEACWRLGSLTKLWACAGLRIGYAIAPDAEHAVRLRLRRPRWSVNGLALAAVADLLAATDLVAWHAALVRLRGEFVDHLATLGVAAQPTDANWVMITSPGLRERLAPHGVVVRDCASFGLPGVHRVAVPRPDQLERVLAAFAHSPAPAHSPLSSPG
jgi:threonine-phosphate decarboxylase